MFTTAALRLGWLHWRKVFESLAQMDETQKDASELRKDRWLTY